MHKKHNLPCILTEIFPLNHVFIAVACPAHILLSKKGIELKLGLKMDESDRKCGTQEPLSYPVY